MTPTSETYELLAYFITHEMRMSHIYQPVMLRELLKRNGAATVTDVARALLAEDRSQVEYYEPLQERPHPFFWTPARRIWIDKGAINTGA